jgi:hypothetical protein
VLGGGGHGLRGVDRNGDRHLEVGHRPQSGRVEGLVGQQQVRPESRCRHADDLARRGAGEAVVSGGVLQVGQRGALVGLHVRAQPVSGQALRHQRDVRGQVGALDDEGGRRQVGHNHGVLSSG